MAGDVESLTQDVMRSPVVETASGKVQGVTANGVHVFKGIPYGASTSGPHRFRPARKPEPWTGVRDAIAYAGRSPQAAASPQRPELATVWGPVDTLKVSEDCLTLHVWTPGCDGAKRPVMVWLHGGAFSYGSANSPRYDSTNLARRNDVVVVAVNHRLNVFGHLDLSQIGGERFAQSGNLGVLDLVEALKWVREHVARFGGDPGNVTIFGQSGGGGKVSALLAMPDAKRLFHKAIVQSGSSVRFADRERTNRLAEAMLKYFALAKDRISELQAVPIDKMMEAVTTAQRSLPKPRYPLLDRYNFGPVIDGTVLQQHPFMPNAPSISDDIPVMVGDTKDEAAIFLAPDNKVWSRAITEDDLKERIGAVAGAQTDAILAYYKKRDPQASATDRLITALTGSNFGVRTMMQAEAKALRNKAPVYTYRLDWETPAYDGKLKAPHSVDVPFIFDTLHVIGAQHQKPGAQTLADRISKTWATFARSGNPSNDSIPAWPAYDTKTRATMVFNDECRVENDPNAEVRPLWRKAAIA